MKITQFPDRFRLKYVLTTSWLAGIKAGLCGLTGRTVNTALKEVMQTCLKTGSNVSNNQVVYSESKLTSLSTVILFF